MRGTALPRSAAFVCLTLLLSAGPLAQAPAPASATRIDVSTGSTAEYRVREQLARLNFPNDAVGTTQKITGGLTLRADGSFARESKITVDLRTLRSDSARRDSFLRENTLHTSRFPLAEFVPRRADALPNPLPSSGAIAFTLIGDMTIHGVTSELLWDVSATLTPTAISGQATTRFPFDRFGLTIPKVMGLLSVDDDIRLVLNLKARRTSR